MVVSRKSTVGRIGARVRCRLFGIGLNEASFALRGFQPGAPEAQDKLERAAEAFIRAYNDVLEEMSPQGIASALGVVDPQLQGFAYEGAGMALALLDCLTPWNRGRLRAFLEGPGDRHTYMVHVGAGWAYARLRRLHRSLDRVLAKMDRLLRWLVVDGYGFHEGYFHPKRFIEGCERPDRLSGYACRAFDQGLGRCLWFVESADVSRVAAAAARFDRSRQEDLYSGVGLACTYAGGVDRVAIKALQAGAESFESHLAQGAAFAAKARQRAGNPSSHTELACEVLCGTSAQEAARVTDTALVDLPDDRTEPSFEVWRRRVQEHYVPHVVAV